MLLEVSLKCSDECEWGTQPSDTSCPKSEDSAPTHFASRGKSWSSRSGSLDKLRKLLLWCADVAAVGNSPEP